MKITIVSNYWKGSNGGGVKTYLTNLVNELEKRNIDVDVIFREGIDKNNYHTPGNKLLFSIRSFWTLSKTKPDAIFTQGTWYSLLSGVLYKFLNPKNKLIHTFHTEPERKLPYLGLVFFQFLLDQCDYVTFVSDNLRKINENLLGLRFKNGFIITHAGVNEPDSISNSDVEEFKVTYSVASDSIVLVAVGLTALKHKADGAKLLIKAIKLLRNKYHNIVLILTREGPFSRELKDLVVKESLNENIIFTGTVDNPAIPVKLCDIYTHTPLGEGGVSLALLEAMAMGKPIIATSVGGIPEAIEGGVNGLLVEPDHTKIAQKIEYLLENKELAIQLGNKAKDTTKEKFTWENTADIFLQLSQQS